MTAHRTTTPLRTVERFIETSQENHAMLLHEDLARVRMREHQRHAEQHRLAHRLSAARRWRRLSNWAAERARLANQHL